MHSAPIVAVAVSGVVNYAQGYLQNSISLNLARRSDNASNLT